MSTEWVTVPVEPTEGMTLAACVEMQRLSMGEMEPTSEEMAGALRAALAAAPQPAQAPIDMVLHCPACGVQHIDGPDERFSYGGSTDIHDYKTSGGAIVTQHNSERWVNPPHRSHLCHGCGHIWRPADVATNGVAAVKTKGKADSPIVQPAQAPTKHTSHLMKLIRAAWKGDRVIAEAYASHLADLLDAESDGRGKYVRQMLEVLRGERPEVFVHTAEPPAQAPDRMDELRRSVAEIIGCDPETWPDHGNAPLAIAAVVALGEKARERLYGKGQHGLPVEQPAQAQGPVCWWNGIGEGADVPSYSPHENTRHDIPLYAGWNEASETVNALKARIAELEAAQAQGWQPIETAPRDETTIIVSRHMGDFGWIRGHARWVGGHGFVAGWVSHGFDPVMGELGLAHPTHWQPLPAPPSDHGKEVGK